VSGEAVPDRASVAEVRAGIAELRARLSELAGRRAPDLDDPVELDELAVRLYGRLRSKLRFELLVDRERAGLLTDFR
jgi:predicted nucleic acid-binding protein